MEELIKLRLGSDIRQSPAYAHYMESLGWQSHLVAGVFVFVRRFGFLSIAKIRRAPPNADWPALMQYFRAGKFLISQVDPESGHPPASFHLKKEQLLGTKTLLVDLRPSAEKILSSFKPETRAKLKKLAVQRHEIKFNGFSLFYKILNQGMHDLGVWCPPLSQYQPFVDAFGSNCFCLTVDGLSGCLVVIRQQVAEYYFAGSLPAGKSQNLPYLVAWLAMLESKKRGAKVWDFNGLIDPRWPDRRWAGFSFFKSRFGGTELSFSGTYAKYGWF